MSSIYSLETLLLISLCNYLKHIVLYLVFLVSGITCEKGYAEANPRKPLDPIYCDGFEHEELQISPPLPEGLFFRDNKLQGCPKERFEAKIFTISSISGRSEEFYIRIGCQNLLYRDHIVDYDTPTSIHIEQEETIITRGVFIYGIQIHTDALVNSITFSPKLPSGLYIDSVRQVITGTYQDTFTGRKCYTISASNSYGSTHNTFCFIFTSISLEQFLIYRFSH